MGEAIQLTPEQLSKFDEKSRKMIEEAEQSCMHLGSGARKQVNDFLVQEYAADTKKVAKEATVLYDKHVEGVSKRHPWIMMLVLIAHNWLAKELIREERMGYER